MTTTRRSCSGARSSTASPPRPARLELLQRAIDVLPDLERAELVQQLAGSRPLSPDSKPIIGPVPGWEGVLLATGHTTKGIHLGPVTGRIIADYVCPRDDQRRQRHERVPAGPFRGLSPTPISSPPRKSAEE